MSESEQREIKKEAKNLYKDDGTVGLYQEQKRIGYIAGATAMAEKNADLKAQLEVAQEKVKMYEVSSPAPLDDDTLLWDIIGDMLFPTVIPKWKDKVKQFKSKFILTRRTEGKGRTEGDLQE